MSEMIVAWLFGLLTVYYIWNTGWNTSFLIIFKVPPPKPIWNDFNFDMIRLRHDMVSGALRDMESNYRTNPGRYTLRKWSRAKRVANHYGFRWENCLN